MREEPNFASDIVDGCNHHNSQSEAFSDFVVHNWRLLATVGGVFSAIYLVGIFSINMEYFYSRFLNDPVVYYAKADHFLRDFSTDMRMAENLPPAKYIFPLGIML